MTKVHCFVILFLTEEEAQKLALCHNYYTNVVDIPKENEEALDWLSEFLQDETNTRLLRAYHSDEKQAPVQINGNVTVIHTGFLM